MFDTHPECVVVKTNSSVRVDVVSISVIVIGLLIAVVHSACGSCFLWCGPYIVKSTELMSGITSDNSDSDSTPELLEHDRKGAAPSPLRREGKKKRYLRRYLWSWP